MEHGDFLAQVAEIVLDEETRAQAARRDDGKEREILQECILGELRWRRDNRAPLAAGIWSVPVRPEGETG